VRIAVTNPTNWPVVRRGAERFINELAVFLTRRGHDVTVISGKPGPSEIRRDAGYTTILHRRLWHPAMARVGVQEFHTFFVTLLAHFLRHQDYDVIHCCTFVDAYAAALARRHTGIPTVLTVNGMIPKVPYIRSLSTGGRVFQRAITEADEVIALSSYMQSALERRFGRRGIRIPVPVDTDRFAMNRTRDFTRPAILCAAALEDPRKGGRALFRAFEQLKRTRPNATLRVSCRLSDGVKSHLLRQLSVRWHKDVQFLGVGDVEDLPRLFGLASVSVLPSVWEGFGMVVLESLATGTPVVCTRDGALPEWINSAAIGRLFDPGGDPDTSVEPENIAGLAQALDEAIELSRHPDTALACRARAEEFSWAAIGPKFEHTYQRVLGRPMAVREEVGA
jgi:phosphatidyl-myo-inositol alpha-mannosyltransferase